MQNKLNDMLLESPLDAKEVLDLSIELNDLIARMLKEMRPEQT
jgi:hypothetical protein